MNTHLKRVIAAYAIAVLTAFVYVPWFGQPHPAEISPDLRYAPVWQPPETIGYLYFLDYGRIALEVISLTLVLLLAAVSLWGEDG